MVKPRVMMNSHKNTLSNILQNPPTNVVRSLVYVYVCKFARARACVCVCVYVCGSVYLRTYACVYVYAYYGSQDLQTMYIISRIHAHTAQLIEFLFVFDTTCDSRMKASFLINYA